MVGDVLLAKVLGWCVSIFLAEEIAATDVVVAQEGGIGWINREVSLVLICGKRALSSVLANSPSTMAQKDQLKSSSQGTRPLGIVSWERPQSNHVQCLNVG